MKSDNKESVDFDNLTEDQQAEIKESFNLFKNDNGQLESSQVKYAFRALGVEAGREDLNSLMRDKNITFNKFKEIAAQLIPKRDANSTLEQAFKLFDKDGSGKISFEDLKLVAVNLGEECSDADLVEMLEFADEDGDGEISKSEFITLMTAKKVL